MIWILITCRSLKKRAQNPSIRTVPWSHKDFFVSHIGRGLPLRDRGSNQPSCASEGKWRLNRSYEKLWFVDWSHAAAPKPWKWSKISSRALLWRICGLYVVCPIGNVTVKWRIVYSPSTPPRPCCTLLSWLLNSPAQSHLPGGGNKTVSRTCKAAVRSVYIYMMRRIELQRQA